MNQIKLSNLKSLHANAISHGRVTDQETSELKEIESQLESLIEVGDLSIDQTNKMTVLLARSGDLTLEIQNSKQPQSIGTRSFKRQLNKLAILLVIVLAIIIYKALNA